MSESIAQPSKPQKIQPVRGTHDWLGQDALAYDQLIQKATHVTQRYGYTPLQTPIFEHTSVFQKTLGEASDIVGKEMYTFMDKGGDTMTLRPEGTAPLVRAFISNGLTQDLPFKAFYHGPMFRYERPQAGRLRQFHQFGAECLGIDHPHSDVEMLHMAWSLFKELNIIDKITLEINTLGDVDSRKNYRNALVHYLSRYEQDLSEDSKRRLLTNPMRILDSKDKNDQKICENAPPLFDYLSDSSRIYFDHVLAMLEHLHIPYTKNPRLVRGLDYYNHTAFEFTTTSLGAQGTVLAGGRYNGLAKSMGGPDIPGIGWAFGMERMLSLWQPSLENPWIISVIALSETFENDAFILSQKLRSHGFCVDQLHTGNAGKKLKRANKIQSSFAILLGEEEMKKGHYILRHFKDGHQELISQTDVINTLKSISKT